MPTINGTLGNDLINSTPEADLIFALSGDDVVNGLGGDDWIAGSQGNDLLDGGENQDTVYGGKGNDILLGGSGNDVLFGDENNDVIYGGDSNDVAAGGGGDDQLFGEAGNDVLFGNQGNDRIYGNLGTDLLFGGAGNDALFGDEGDDTLVGDLGADTLVGGASRDVFVVSPRTGGSRLSEADAIADFQLGEDAIALSEGLTLNNLVISQLGNDTLLRLRRLDGSEGDYLALLLNVNASSLNPTSFLPMQMTFNLPNTTPTTTGSSSSAFVSVDQGVLTVNIGNLQPPTATQVRTNLFSPPIVSNPLAGIPPFLNPTGTQQIRDPATGEFVPVGVNQPGTIFSPGGLPTTPGITQITPAQLPAPASGIFYLDASGIPRPVNQLTLGGGNIPPFLDPEGNLVTATPLETILSTPSLSTPALAPLYFDFQGIPRLSSELASPMLGDNRYLGFTGAISPLLTPAGDPILARAAVLATNPMS